MFIVIQINSLLGGKGGNSGKKLGWKNHFAIVMEHHRFVNNYHPLFCC
jgi:hypothetical protein